MNEHKAVPNIRFKGFDDEWKNEFIKNISTMKSGGTPSVNKREYYVGDIPFIRSSDIKNESTELKINDEAIKNSSSFMVEKGTVLYALYGATSGQVSISKVTGAINQAVLAIFPNEIVNKYFLVYWLSFNKEKITNKYLQGGQGNLSAKIVKNLLLPFPTKFEQQKIGDFFTKLDKLLDLQQQKIDKLELLKKALLKKLFPKHDAKIPEFRFNGYKKNWEKDLIGNVSASKSGGTPSIAEKKYYDGNIPFIRSSDINKSRTELCINDNAVKHSSTFIVEKGSVLYALYGATSGQVALSKEKGAINQAVLAIFPKNYIEKNFLMYWFIYSKKKIVSKYLQGGQGNLSAKIIKSLMFCFPNKSEQQKIGNFLSKVDQLIELENKKLHNLQQVKKCLLQNMFVE